MTFNHSNIMSSQVERETCTARCSSSVLWSLTPCARTSTLCSCTSHQVHPLSITRYLHLVSVQDVHISHQCVRAALCIVQYQYLDWTLRCKSVRWWAERRRMGRDWPHNQSSEDGGRIAFLSIISFPVLSCLVILWYLSIWLLFFTSLNLLLTAST